MEAASDGPEALERFCEGAFDIVITDRAMPEMSGDDLAEAIKAKSPRTPVIMLTGFGDIMLATGEAPSPMDLIVAKPVTMGNLREAVAKVAA